MQRRDNQGGRLLMRTPARPRLPDGDCVFISDVRIVARAVIAGAPRDLERGCGLSWIEELGISDARGFHFGVQHEVGALLFEVLDLLPPVGMGFLLWASATIGFLSPTCMGRSTSAFSRYREDRSSVHGATACSYSLISTRVSSLTCGFANGARAARVDSLAMQLAACRLQGSSGNSSA